ncbi:MAG TPA: hypothetical protein EYP56_02320 [Planctomycetaceae bacterium]|nr:hypothetical protein [Planctomycetaceae bacterium]
MNVNRIVCVRRRTGALAAVAWVAVCTLATPAAQPQKTRNIVPGSTSRSDWAIVVGIVAGDEKSEHAWRTNDAELVAATLAQSGYRPKHILVMTRRAAEPGLHPLRANLKTQLAGFLRRLGPDDRLLVYWAGPACRDADGAVYLAPADWDAAQMAETGLALTWLRTQLERCAAKWKLLVLDVDSSSEAGAERPAGLGGESVATAFEGVPGLVILASRRAGQESLVWEPAEQSLFGFWFTQALAGHADRNADKRVSVGELYDYLFQKVAKTARDVFGRTQTPVRFPASGLGHTPVSHVQPTTLGEALDQMAEQLTVLSVQNQVRRLGVAEFRLAAASDEAIQLIALKPCIAGRWCAEELQRRMGRHRQLAGAQFELTPHDELHTALTRGRFSPASLRTSAVRGIVAQGKSVETVVLGSFCVRTDRLLTLRAELRDTKARGLLGRVQAVAMLSPLELGMFSINWAVHPDELHTPPAPSPTYPDFSGAKKRMKTPTSTLPPQLDPNFPFRVAIYVDGKPRESIFVGTDEYVPLALGEMFQIKVENHSDERVYLRLLVDGLNTLDEPVPGPPRPDGQPTTVYRPHQRVSLDRARAWRPEPHTSYMFKGFYHRTGETPEGDGEYECDLFKVVETSKSFGYQQGYTEKLGVITAAFCKVPQSPGRPRGIPNQGVGPGGKKRGTLEEYPEGRVGPSIGVVNIYYVAPEEFEALRKQASGVEQQTPAEEPSPHEKQAVP